MTETDPNKIKAGKYELVALRWDEILSKPGEPFDFTRHHRGDEVTLNVEEARRLVLAGAVVKPSKDGEKPEVLGSGPSVAPEEPVRSSVDLGDTVGPPVAAVQSPQARTRRAGS